MYLVILVGPRPTSTIVQQTSDLRLRLLPGTHWVGEKNSAALCRCAVPFSRPTKMLKHRYSIER